MLAEGLRAVITQRLLPNRFGDGLVLAAEILMGTLPVANLIRTEKTFQLSSVMRSGKGHRQCNSWMNRSRSSWMQVS